jgi:hypothetical protein
MRDDFSEEVKRTVAARVGFHCSNPRCRKLTSGPGADPTRALSIGVAAHITAASAGGPRYDESLTPEQRSSIENAIWLCQSCGTLVDRDLYRFSVTTLYEWKHRAENAAATELAAGTTFRPIAASEVRRELTLGELAAVRALADEFGCDVVTNLSIPAGDGWLNLHAAVVRGDDLVAIEIRENKGNEVPYFQIEHLIQLGSTLKFPRFHKFVLYVAVVSEVSSELDEPVKEKLEQMARTAPCEVHIRVYRLNTLRAKYNL